MSSQEGCATESTTISGISSEENERITESLDVELSSRRQMSSSRPIRFYTGLFAIVMVVVGLSCFTNNNDNVHGMTSESDSRVSSILKPRARDRNSSQTLPKVQQPTKLLSKEEHPDHNSLIRKLRSEFHEWTVEHGRDYGSRDEKEKRFQIWKDNHLRTMEKNEKHGPCKLTGKAVFGSNHFKDLTTEEFQTQYLTGYSGPHTDKIPNEHQRRKLRSDQVRKVEDILKSGAGSGTSRRRLEPENILSSNGLHDPSVLSNKIRRHSDVQERYLKHIQQAPILEKTYYSKEEKYNERICKCGSSGGNSGNNGYYNGYNNYNNYNGNRLLKSITEKFPKMGKTYYSKSEKQKVCGYGKTYYNSNNRNNNNGSYSKVDCSKYKMEQADNLETSNAYEYSNTKCSWYDASCRLQTIFTPIYTSSSEKYYYNYNYPSSMDWRKVGAVTSVHSQGSCGACWAITAVETIESVNYINTGTLYDLSETEVIICDTSCEMCDGGWPQNAYQYAIDNNGLPKDGTYSYDGDFLMTMTTVLAGDSDELTEDDLESVYASTCPDSDSKSHDSNDDNDNDTTSSVPRYGAITGYAYATDRCVCYTDGSGCDCDEQNEVLAVMNVASFGPATVCLDASTWQDYTGGIITADSGCSSAFLDMNHCVQTVGYAFMEVEDEDGDEGEGDSKSKSGDDNGNKQLEGYWIIRNQWSSYWGMSGYAYVSMGSNTCGVLNDMTQVFMD